MVLFLATACAEESKDASDSASAKTASGTETAADTDNQGDSIMNQPVDFSTPENVEKTLQNIREQKGDKAYKNLENAMKYLLYYDLSLANNKEKMYKKLDGSTPEQIIAKTRR
jgi:hypothetical protein